MERTRTGFAVLAGMMFLQFAIWGAWWVSLGSYLGALDFPNVGAYYATQGIAAIAASLFVGFIADRYVAADRLMVVLHGAGALLLWWLSRQQDAGAFWWITLAYMLCYMPTLALSATIALRHLGDGARQFPLVRVFGTIGWIAAGWMVSGRETTATPILFAAAFSAIAALFALLLPSTPPAGDRTQKPGIGALFGFDILKSHADRAFWVFIAASLVVCIPLGFYYAYANQYLTSIGVPNATAVQSLGQVSEIAFMVALPVILTRYGIKAVLLAGMLAWAARYVAFGLGDWQSGSGMALVLAGILLHGICYDFFFVAGQIHIDRILPPEMRARGQAFISFVTLGVGAILGTRLSDVVINAHTAADGTRDWATIWLMPAAMAGATAVIFALLFRQRTVPAGAGN